MVQDVSRMPIQSAEVLEAPRLDITSELVK